MVRIARFSWRSERVLPLILLIGLLIIVVPLTIAAPNPTPSPAVARMWHGKTAATKADEYTTYLYEAGIKKIRSIDGNLDVQTLRRVENNMAEFYVISYWKSRDAIRKFAGTDIEKTRPLPRDSEFLIEPELRVKHYEVLYQQPRS